MVKQTTCFVYGNEYARKKEVEENRLKLMEKDVRNTKKSTQVLSNMIASQLLPQIKKLFSKFKRTEEAIQSNQAAGSEVGQGLDEIYAQIKNMQVQHERDMVLLQDEMSCKLDAAVQSVREENENLVMENAKLVGELQESIQFVNSDLAQVKNKVNELEIQLQDVNQEVRTNRKIMEQDKNEFLKNFGEYHGHLETLSIKLFNVEKGLVKVHALLPANAGSKLALDPSCPVFNKNVEAPDTEQTKLIQRQTDMESEIDNIKSEISSCRSADRRQFDSIMRRIRDLTKQTEVNHAHTDENLDRISSEFQKLACSIPSSVTDKYAKALELWDNEINDIRHAVAYLKKNFGVFDEHSASRESILVELSALKLESKNLLEMQNEAQDRDQSLWQTMDQLQGTVQAHVFSSSEKITKLDTDVASLVDMLTSKVLSEQRTVPMVAENE